MKKLAKDLKPGDIIEGVGEVSEVRNLQFRTAENQKNALWLVNERGMKVEQACNYLGLIEGTDWRWA